MSQEIERALDTLVPVPAGRFLVLYVNRPDPGSTKKRISNFVREHGLNFETGRGFYEFTKPELVQQNKEIVLMRIMSGECFTGPKLRQLLGLPQQGGTCGCREGRVDVRIDPIDFPNFHFFIQSTSHTRRLLVGTRFLYEANVSY